jgi:glycosyltransferase involved in cell wall biosynthesis
MSSVSVIIPTRDRAATLGATVRSALDVEPLEVIVVDCGSADGSIELIRGFGDGVRLIHGDFPNAAAARNAGAREAAGDLLGFLDSDDLARPGKTECLAGILQADGMVGLVHGDLVVIDPQGRPDAPATRRFREQRIEAAAGGTDLVGLSRRCVMFTSATLLRREAFEQAGGYDEALPIYEDWDLYLRLASEGWRLVYADCDAAGYRRWEGNVAWDRTARGVIEVARKHLAMLPQMPPADRRAVESALWARIAGSAHTLLDGPQARRAAVASIRSDAGWALRQPVVLRALTASWLPRSILARRREAATR